VALRRPTAPRPCRHAADGQYDHAGQVGRRDGLPVLLAWRRAAAAPSAGRCPPRDLPGPGPASSRRMRKGGGGAPSRTARGELRRQRRQVAQLAALLDVLAPAPPGAQRDGRAPRRRTRCGPPVRRAPAESNALGQRLAGNRSTGGAQMLAAFQFVLRATWPYKQHVEVRGLARRESCAAAARRSPPNRRGRPATRSSSLSSSQHAKRWPRGRRVRRVEGRAKAAPAVGLEARRRQRDGCGTRARRRPENGRARGDTRPALTPPPRRSLLR
jgi:hypothetical protein